MENKEHYISSVTEKGQTTIPKEVRKYLKIKPGDKVTYAIKDGVAIFRRIEPFDIEYHQALAGTLSEWSSKEDDEAFHDL